MDKSTSLPGSEGEGSPADSPACLTTSPSSLRASPASQPVKPESDSVLETSGGCGPSSSGCFAVYDPITRSWSSLQASFLSTLGLSGNGSAVSWPRSFRVTRCRAYPLRTWALPTSENASGSWPTPRASDGPEPSSHGRTWSSTDYNLHTATREWATPRAEDGERGANSQHDGLMEDVNAWATPAAQDERNGMLPPSQATRDTLPGNVVAWATPDAQAFNAAQTREEHAAAVAKMKAKRYNGNGAGETLGIMANSFSPGAMPSPSEALTEPLGSSRKKPLKPGLNPRFGLWLQGYPAEWLDCERPATRGVRKPPSRRST
jgi:hypothetical protein